LFAHVDPAEDGAALYNDSGLVNWLPGVNARPNPLMLDSFTFASPTDIYGLPEGSTFFAELQVGSAGLSVVSPGGYSCCDEVTGSSLASDGTLLYTNSGEVWNPATQTLLGTYLEPTGSQLFYVGRPIPDDANGHTYFLDSMTGYSGFGSLDIDVFDQVNYGLASTVPFVNANFASATDLARWGSNGLAFRSYDSTGTTQSADQIVILTSSKVNSSGGVPRPIVSSVSPATVYVGGPAFTLQVEGSGFTSASTVLIGGSPRSTTYFSATLLTAQALASDIAAAGGVNVQVTTPAPGGGTSNYSTILITTQTPVVSVTPSPLNATTAQTVTVTVSLSGASGYPAPTGTVALSSSIYSTEPVTLSGGSATISLPAGSLVIGTDTLTVSYVPDSAGSSVYRRASGLATVSVGVPTKTTPSVSVTPSAPSITTAQPLTETIAVSGGSGNPTPTGYLTVTLGGSILGEPYLTGGSGTISFGAGQLPVGNDTLTVSYTPDSTSSSTYNNSTGTATVVVTVPAKITPTVSVKPSAPSVTTAQALTVTIAVSGGTGNPTPTGFVSLSGGGFTSAATIGGSGSQTINIPAGSLTSGTDKLTVSYMPDSASSSTYNGASGSATVTVTSPIGTSVSTVTLAPSAATITNDQVVTVKITVAGGSGQATPTGNVTLASGSYSAQQTLAGGTASFNIVAGTLTSGANTLTASYGGDANYAIASGTTTVTVAEVTIAIPAPSSVSPGGSATATATLAAGSSYSGTMNLHCSLTASPTGAQSVPTCNLNPAAITLATGGNATTTLTINTTAASGTAHAIPLRRNLWGLGGGGALLAGFLIFWVPSGRRRIASMLLLLTVAMSSYVIGCGGGGGQTTGSGTPATTAGSYTFTVTGTDSANAKTTISANVVVMVQ